MLWYIKSSGNVLSKLKSRGFCVTSLSTNDFSILYTILPHNLIKENLDLIERAFKMKVRFILHVMIRKRTNCAPLVADLFLFCYERDFMISLSDDN